MRRHMLIYHVGVPLAVFGVLLLLGVPLGSAFGVAIAAGCVSMVVMMAAGGHRHGHEHATRPAGQTRPSAGDGTAAPPARR